MDESTLSEAEIKHILSDPAGLLSLADFWRYQETMFDSVGDCHGSMVACDRAEQYELRAANAQVAIDNGD